MIDTIILRVHDLQKNRNLVNSLDHSTNEGYETQLGDVPLSDLNDILRKGVKDTSVIIEALKFKSRKHGKGRFIMKTKVGKHMNQSNHYVITYFINYFKDYIEFNFSIPKYNYGTNIFLFVRHRFDKGYILPDASKLEHNFKDSYGLLMSFLRRFFHWEFAMCKIDPKDVEVNRIDLCFNQVFKNKEEALLYLEYQKRLKKKYARDEDGVMQGYATSLMYVTKRYSVKIYHKGTEYDRHDKKEHRKYNEKHRNHYFKIDKLQAFSDKILRYEITIRNPFFNYLHKRFLFRKNDSVWNEMYKDYILIESLKQMTDRISKKVGSIKDMKEKITYLLKHKYPEPAGLKEKSAHKAVSKIISRSRKFCLATDLKSELFNSRCLYPNDDNVLFSEKLLELCFKKFFAFIKEFQIQELPGEEIVKRQLEQHNKIFPSSKLPVSEMLGFYEHLVKHGSFKDAAKFGHYSRATLYRYITRFKQIGIDEKCITPIDKSFGIPDAPLNLRQYHYEVGHDDMLRGVRITEVSRIK